MARFEFGLSRFEGIDVQEFESVFRNFVRLMQENNFWCCL